MMHPDLFARRHELPAEWQIELDYMVHIFNERAEELAKLENENIALRAMLDVRD